MDGYGTLVSFCLRKRPLHILGEKESQACNEYVVLYII